MPYNNPIVRVSTGKINTVNDVACGGGSADRPLAEGQLGQEVTFTEAEAQKIDSALHAGTYKYVRFKAGSTASNAKGQVVVWDDPDSFVVTPDVAAASSGLQAGVTLNAVSKGQYGFVQVDGLATVLCNASVGGTTAGDLAVVDATAPTVSAIADATAASTDTALEVKRIIGTFVEAPANGALKLVALKGIARV